MKTNNLTSAVLLVAAAVNCATAATVAKSSVSQTTTSTATEKSINTALGGTSLGSIGTASASAATNPNDDMDKLSAQWPYGFYVFQDAAKNKVVATGSNGRVLIWDKTNSKEQVWRFLKDGGRFRLQNMQNDQFASIAWNGWYWRGSDNIATFSLVSAAGGKFRLQENTKNEYFTVGGDGGMVRWSATGDARQEFALGALPLKATATAQGNFSDVQFAQFTASSDGKEMWALSLDGVPVRLTLSSTTADWIGVPTTVRFSQLAVGSASNVWALDATGNIYRYSGDTWNPVAGNLKQISAATDGTVVGVNAGDEIFRYENGSWVRLPGLLRSISAGSAQSIWGVNAAGQVYRWSNSTWQPVTGGVVTSVGTLSFQGIRRVSVSKNGVVIGVDLANRPFHWTGTEWHAINIDSDTIKYVQAVDAVPTKTIIGADGQAFGIKADGAPFTASYKR